MNHDEVVWDVIGNTRFCSYKVKPPAASHNEQKFCRNPHNVSGLCNRLACPLANSRYATIIEEEGVVYLYIKTAERCHTPKNMWEKIKLPQNFAMALRTIDKHLMFWPKFNINKCKQRLTRIHQYLIRMRRLQLKVQPKLVGKYKKVERREKNREVKALKAAKLTEQIKNELLERLHQGTYGDIYNFPQQQYDEILDVEGEQEVEDEEEGEEGPQFVEAYDSDIMSDGLEDLADALPGSNSDESGDEELVDDDAVLDAAKKRLQDIRKGVYKKVQPPKKPAVEIEYEVEEESLQTQ